MLRKVVIFVLLLTLALVAAGCRKNKTVNPIANLDSKQPDKVLYDRAMASLKKNRFDEARLTLQTLINTYPDSEYIARAKLSVGDSWYAEGTSAALAQAEVEYKDFQTFFPNMPEAAEAQMKVAHIHYKQMEKPDRDFTHARRAEDEYRQLILQYPDSPLVDTAKQRLREVQEVLAEREFRIGRFYYLRESWTAAIARLQTLADKYPLYSGMDETLMMLADSYDRQAEIARGSNMTETDKAKLIQSFNKPAAEAYKRLIERYPLSPLVEDAKARLAEMNLPVPTPTEEAIAQHRAEIESRGEIGMWDKIWGNFKRGPNVETASKAGEPTLTDPEETNAPDLIRETMAIIGKPASGNVTVETIKDGKPGENQPIPRSQQDGAGGNGASQGNGEGEAALPPPQQVNDAGTQDSAEQEGKTDSKNESSSKKKKKSIFRKMIPF